MVHGLLHLQGLPRRRRRERSDNYRLQRIESGGASDANHQYLVYSYDAVGNVTRIEDWNAGSPAPQVQVFTYDALDRPVTAQALSLIHI